MERHFTNGVESGIGKVYNKNAPYNLQQIYEAKNGKSLLMKEYYDDGKPRYLFSDTVLKGEHLRYFQSFSESGYLTQTAFYVNDTITQGEMKEYYTNGNVKSSTNFQNGVPDGVYKYFYDNGQLWTERLYSKGKVMEIISNFNREGKPVVKGTLKAGTGTVIVYDEEGKQTRVLTYKNGELIR
jgi:antitoxin component YwqK of YwqJK toxin-antitoxin module